MIVGLPDLKKVDRTQIGFYCPGNGTGGPWRYVHSLLAGMDADEFEATLFCDLPGIYEPRPEVKVVSLSGPVHHFNGSPMPVPNGSQAVKRSSFSRLAPQAVRLWAGFGRQSRELARLIGQHHVDIFHTQNTGCEESPVAAKLAGVRHVLGTFHVGPSVDLHQLRNGPRYRMLEFVSNRCLNRAIAVSESMKRDWIRRTRIPADRVVTIHNGIDREKFGRRQRPEQARREFGLPAEGPIIGAVGRLDEVKGLTYLLSAAAQLLPEFPTLTVAIAGTGPLAETLKEEATRLGLGNAVRFLGFQPDVQKVLDALDVFAIPSLSEALGYSLLEAMASELPAVGSAVGGVPEVIVTGETGFLVPPRDGAALAAALRPLLNSAELRERLGRAGRERVCQHFQESEMVRRTLDVYRTMLAGRPRKVSAGELGSA